ncbi:MAG TPA: lmo0937 family membrane protein [Terriglobales bacterium]|nr:lmo0937 family membrane protein [Terriglobales bacterium]
MLVVGVFFLALWITGLVTAHTMGGFIHVLLVLAIMALLNNLIRGNHSRRLADLRSSAAQPGTWGSERS